jgi:hypothetical protein
MESIKVMALPAINLKEMCFCFFRAKEEKSLSQTSRIFFLLGFFPLAAKFCL